MDLKRSQPATKEGKAMGQDYAKYLDKEIYKGLNDQFKAQLQKTWQEDKNITIQVIKEKLGYNEHAHYRELDRLGVPYKKRKYVQRNKAAIRKRTTGCEISLGGTSEPQQLLDQIDRLKTTINPDAMLYEFSIKIKELAE